MFNRFGNPIAALLLSASFVVAGPALADSAVEQNSNVIGVTQQGAYRGIPAMQDNEASCGINPILLRNFVCAWNASGGSDGLIGDTWIRFSESQDSGRTFFNRYLPGSNLDPATSLGLGFAADPIMLCWPGGCGTVFLAADRATGGGVNGGIYMALLPESNIESGVRHLSKTTLDQVYAATGAEFADKPYAIYLLDEDNPGTVTVTADVERPDGTVETITREWPKGRIIVAFAVGDPSADSIRILSTYSDDYGANWSTPVEIVQRKYWDNVDGCTDEDNNGCRVRSPLNQGVNISAIGDTVLYAFRRFAFGDEGDAILGAISQNRGRHVRRSFEIVPDLCAYDVPTLPSTANSTAAASRTNGFPWTSSDGNQFVLAYSERRRSSDGGCLTDLTEPSDSRIMAIVSDPTGKQWGTPVQIAPNAMHGFQFMPVVECSLGQCQAAWWDTRRDSERTRNFLLDRGDPVSLAALNAFETIPLFADFNFPTGNGIDVIQFRRTADMYTAELRIDSGSPVVIDNPPVLASRYRLGLVGGEVVERESNPFNIKAYRDNTVPFMSDYSWLTSVRLRLVFDPAQPELGTFWQSNNSPDPLNPTASPQFWLAWTDARNMRGQIYTANIEDQVPYTRTPMPAMVTEEGDEPPSATSPDDNEESLSAESVEDSNPGAIVCTPTPNPGAGAIFTALNNRTKDADIYGALIEDRVSAFSLNPTKTLGTIQRTYTIIAENASDIDRVFRLEIANQPIGFPEVARASWDQLPFDPTASDFATTPPDEVEFEPVGPQSSVTVALFVVSQLSVNPVTVNVFDDATGELVNAVTINGAVEAGPLLNPDFTVNDFERHNPAVFVPDQYNPDQYNPDQYNPDQYNPDLYNPDQYNPDQYNPDQFNPDQYNPDQYNPDLYNPDQFNPDQYNPDLYNPDQYNATLADADTLDNPEIPNPGIPASAREPDGTVVKLDVTFGIQNVGNTLTPYTVDFAVADEVVLDLLASGQIVAQLIAWQDKQIQDVQFCDPQIITENRIVSVANNPNLFTLQIPDINDNRLGELTYFIAANDILQNTIRFIGRRDAMETLAERLPNNIISYAFTSQAANTGETQLVDAREQIVNNREPAVFNFNNGDVVSLPPTSSAGAVIPADLVVAFRGFDSVPVSCAPPLGSTAGLDIFNAPAGPTNVLCTAVTDSGVVSTVSLFVSVVDTDPPTIDPASVPADVIAEVTGPGGATVSFTTPTATDANGIDPLVDVTCDPAPGAAFPFAPPGPTTTVTCTAADDSGNTDTATFNVTVADSTPPVFVDDPLPAVVAEAAGPSGAVVSFPLPVVTDLGDAAPVVSCAPASGSLFGLGVTPVACTATDSSGNVSSAGFDVDVRDTTPPVITLIGDNPFIVETGQAFVDPGAQVVDIADPSVTLVVDDSAVNTAIPGSYLVTYDAVDASGNPAATATRTVQVVDTTPPVITLNGANPFVVEVGQPFVDPGATVADVADPAVALVIDASAVNSGVVGNYLVTYDATDASGNAATTVTRTVQVVDTTPPVIALIGANPFIVEAGNAFVDPGAVVADVGDPAVALMVDASAVNTGVVGTYEVIYSAVDASGNSATVVTRTVQVIDTSAPDLSDFDPPTFNETAPFVLADDLSTFELQWSGDIDDADPNLSVTCNVGTLISVPPPYVFEYAFPAGTTTVNCTATDTQGNTDSVSFSVTIVDQTAPVITLTGDAEIAVAQGSGPYTDPGATATDNGAVANDLITIDASAVDTETFGSYTVVISATDTSGNRSEVTRTVIVGYAGFTGITPKKIDPRLGSSNPLSWAWLGENDQPTDSSADMQMLRIEECLTGAIVFQVAGDPGTSGFRYKNGTWEFNWQVQDNSVYSRDLPYCAIVRSGATGQEQGSPPITFR